VVLILNTDWWSTK